MTISELKDRFISFRDSLKKGEEQKAIIDRLKNEIIKLNTESQLYDGGLNSFGVPIDEYKPYAPVTVEYKISVEQPYDRVTLKDTGAFYKSFYVESDHKGFFIWAKDEKTKELTKKYGESIFGLTDDSISILQEKINDELFNDFRKAIWQQ